MFKGKGILIVRICEVKDKQGPFLIFVFRTTYFSLLSILPISRQRDRGRGYAREEATCARYEGCRV